MNNIDISIVIPAYKEEFRLPYTLLKLKEFIENSKLQYEIIIVVEKSPDNTLEVAYQWKNKMSEIIVIENKEKLGKGGAVQKGILKSNGNIIGFMDADGSTDLSFIDIAYNKIINNQCDGIIASRALKNSVIQKKQPLYRTFLGYVFRKITQYISKLPFNDTQCGCKFFHYNTKVILFENIIEKGFAFDLEILMRAKNHNLVILEEACIWDDKEGSTVNPIKDSLRMLKAVCNLNKYYNKQI